MREIKKLGFGLMRLPLNSVSGADIDMEQFKKMVDLFLEQISHLPNARRRQSGRNFQRTA